MENPMSPKIPFTKKKGLTKMDHEHGAESYDVGSDGKPHKKLLQRRVDSVAQQLTLIEHCAFCQIRSDEFRKLNFQKRADTHAQHFSLLKKLHLRMVCWFTSQILEYKTPSERAKVIGFLLKVAEVCLDRLKNFNAVLEIASALGSNAIFRLQKTWKLVKSKDKILHEKISAVCSLEKNYKHLRKRIELCSSNPNQPCLPYPGIFCKDLVTVEEFPNMLPVELEDTAGDTKLKEDRKPVSSPRFSGLKRLSATFKIPLPSSLSPHNAASRSGKKGGKGKSSRFNTICFSRQ
jgi:hypothetical protein